jgi:hypothetical protein
MDDHLGHQGVDALKGKVKGCVNRRFVSLNDNAEG